jgi:hypothetical protein
MINTMMVANHLKKEGRKPSIRFEEIQSGPLSPDHHVELTIALHELCGNSNAGTTSNNYPAPLYESDKALSKGVKSAAMSVCDGEIAENRSLFGYVFTC